MKDKRSIDCSHHLYDELNQMLFVFLVTNYSTHPGLTRQRPPLPDYQAATTRRQQQQQYHQPQPHLRSFAPDTSVYVGVGHGPVAGQPPRTGDGKLDEFIFKNT